MRVFELIVSHAFKGATEGPCITEAETTLRGFGFTKRRSNSDRHFEKPLRFQTSRDARICPTNNNRVAGGIFGSQS
jgi:hypothetical protein